ncbi:hypothetical protein [Alteribacillus iranensis]|nr:hypothetical protein [Alteribacillus iranensis]
MILVAANAPKWKVFSEELNINEGAIRFTGESFNPLNQDFGGGGDE